MILSWILPVYGSAAVAFALGVTFAALIEFVRTAMFLAIVQIAVDAAYGAVPDIEPKLCLISSVCKICNGRCSN